MKERMMKIAEGKEKGKKLKNMIISLNLEYKNVGICKRLTGSYLQQRRQFKQGACDEGCQTLPWCSSGRKESVKKMTIKGEFPYVTIKCFKLYLALQFLSWKGLGILMGPKYSTPV